jgi:hypothetical protein
VTVYGVERINFGLMGLGGGHATGLAGRS